MQSEGGHEKQLELTQFKYVQFIVCEVSFN